MSLLGRLRKASTIGAHTVQSLAVGSAAILLVVMVAILFTQVVFRYLLHRSLPWSEELARHMLVWYGLLSASVAAYKGQHFAIHAVTKTLPTGVRRIVKAVVRLGTVALFLYLSVLSYRYLGMVTGLHAVATGLDMRVPYAALPVSFLALSLIYLCEFVSADAEDKIGLDGTARTYHKTLDQ